MDRRAIAVAAIAAVLVGAIGGYELAQRTVGREAMKRVASTTSATQSSRPVVLYWHDPMVPGVKFANPGKSPFMDMDLVPVYADRKRGARGTEVSVDPNWVQSGAVRTAIVRRGALDREVRAFGTVVQDERLTAVVQSRAEGYVSQLYIRTPYTFVRAGDPLLEFASPSWSESIRQYLFLRRVSHADPTSVAWSRERLLVAGVPLDAVEKLESDGRFAGSVTLRAPRAGIVTEIGVAPGAVVSAGATLFRINGLDSVWIQAEVPESQTPGIEAGAAVEITSVARPGQTLHGAVAAVLPVVSRVSRTQALRIVCDNPAHDLVPGMSVGVTLRPRARADAVLVPSAAIIWGGRSNYAILALADGHFDVQQVKTGIESDGNTEVLEGLAPGQTVVVSGQFLIDSEAELQGAFDRLTAKPGTVPSPK